MTNNHWLPLKGALHAPMPAALARCAGKMRRRAHVGLVCRAREKVHRPQTRRRRENNEDSLDKMQQMRKNIRKAVEIAEHLVRREHKKLHIAVRPPLSRSTHPWPSPQMPAHVLDLRYAETRMR